MARVKKVTASKIKKPFLKEMSRFTCIRNWQAQKMYEAIKNNPHLFNEVKECFCINESGECVIIGKKLPAFHEFYLKNFVGLYFKI